LRGKNAYIKYHINIYICISDKGTSKPVLIMLIWR
jgi:hypothetical protein